MQQGCISQLVPDGEYGRIRTSDGLDVHFHKHCLWDVRFADLMLGQQVEFEVQPSYKGYLAFHIRPLEHARADGQPSAAINHHAV